MKASNENAPYVVLIPAYKPDERLVTLVRTLREKNLPVTVVDDGGGAAYATFFDQCAALGADVACHAVNQGKGRALKTGINHILRSGREIAGVVTADADGQHTPQDILRIIDAMRENPTALVLGVRAFKGKVPFKSLAGNTITRAVYTLASGIRVSDTQTGLRGLPAGSLEQMMRIDGERYEYEMNMLLKLREMNMPVAEVPIETIYIDDNKGSHFNPIRDAWRIYRVILTYVFASVSSFVIDYALYLLLLSLTARVFGWDVSIAGGVSYVGARIVSSLYNYNMNKFAVFGGKGGKGTIVRYYVLAFVQMLIGAGLTMVLSPFAHIGVSWIKLPIDIVLFFVSYIIQRDFVFKNREKTTAA